jgi:lipid-binding SYLF domain-containing protein
MSTGATIVLIIVVLAVLLAAGWLIGGRMRSRKLRDRFGPEYDRRI